MARLYVQALTRRDEPKIIAPGVTALRFDKEDALVKPLFKSHFKMAIKTGSAMFESSIPDEAAQDGVFVPDGESELEGHFTPLTEAIPDEEIVERKNYEVVAMDYTGDDILDMLPEEVVVEDVIENDRIDAEKFDLDSTDAFNYHGSLRAVRKDIQVFEKLTDNQKRDYPFSECVSKFSEVYTVGKNITQKTFDQWIRRNLIDGWQVGDPAYKINDPAWEVGKKDDLFVIDANTSGDAFAYMNLKSGVGTAYYWRRRISGELIKRSVVFKAAGVRSSESNYTKAIEAGFIGSEELFNQLYDGSFELYKASLLAVFGESLWNEYTKALNDGFVGSINKFLVVFEGKYALFQEHKSLFVGETDDVDEVALNERMKTAKTADTIIDSFAEEVFKLAIIRLERNIVRIKEWREYVLDLQTDNLYSAGKTAAYMSLREDAAERDRTWMLNDWLNQPNPHIRQVQENFIVGNFNGGGQFCHSMNYALQQPDIKTETPLNQLHDLQQQPSDTGTVWSVTQAPKTILNQKEIDDLLVYLNSLDTKESSTTKNTEITSNNQVTGNDIYPAVSEADGIVGQLNQVLMVLGSSGYNVLPIDVFTAQQNISGEEMRKQIIETIDVRVADYTSLIQDIKSEEIKFYELAPVMNDLMASLTDETVKEEITSYLKRQQKKEVALGVVKIVGSIAALFLGVPPVLVSAFWITEGVKMIAHGSVLAKGEGATDVMSPETVNAGKQMITDGVFLIFMTLLSEVAGLKGLGGSKSPLPSTVSKGEYVFVKTNPSSYVVRQTAVPNEYAVITNNAVAKTNTCQLFRYNSATQKWDMVAVETRAYEGVNATAVTVVNQTSNVGKTNLLNTNLPAVVNNAGNIAQSHTGALKNTYDDIIRFGGSAVENNGVLKLLSKNGDEVAQISNGKILPSKYFDDVAHSGATPIGQPSNGYQVFKKGNDLVVKRMPDKSAYSQAELTELTQHPDAHVLERHGHDVTDEALVKRSGTPSVAPDGNTLPNPPPYSSKFESAEKLKDALNNTKPSSANFNPPTKGNSYAFDYPLTGQASTSFGYGIPAGGGSPVQMYRVKVVYKKEGGVWKLLTMYPQL
jgi:hypothetical protein